MTHAILEDTKKHMEAGLEAFSKDLSGLRTGRASVTFLDRVMVSSYGAMVPLNQVATVSVGDVRSLIVQVWDQNLVKSVEKAIRDAHLGINPIVEGNVLRIPLPDITSERRQELIKVAGGYAEKARVAIRNMRRDAMEIFKKQEKEKLISEDEHRRLFHQTQDLTDQFIQKIDDLLARKEQDISKV